MHVQSPFLRNFESFCKHFPLIYTNYRFQTRKKYAAQHILDPGIVVTPYKFIPLETPGL